jgi:hypothetical protein
LYAQGATQRLLAAVNKGMHGRGNGSSGVDITFVERELTLALQTEDAAAAGRLCYLGFCAYLAYVDGIKV